ncbi:MAG: hypothetical protein GY719_20580 [bacterium]|nr:hypothetical protein [bacterium]
MLPRVLALVLLALPGSVCGPTVENPIEESLRETILAEIQTVRRQAGLEPLELHPALCEIARDEVEAVAASGGTPGSAGHIPATTRRLYRAGYAPHAWTEGSLIGTSDEGILDQWRRARPEWFAENVAGDFEHVGIGVARHRGRPVVTLVMALAKRTVEWRQAAPLADLPAVRALVLATVNEIRRAHGRDPLTADGMLDVAAQRHAEDMQRRGYYDHDSPEGESSRQRVKATGYKGARTVGENIAKGLFTPDEVVHRWMNSSGHRRNILTKRVTEMGLGVAVGVNEADELEVLWVQVFASR